jgi:hypothetical protein
MALDNPPLLVVCDLEEYRIYPQFEGISGQPFVFYNRDLLRTETRDYLRWLLTEPGKFKERREKEAEERSKLTEEQAAGFARLADYMRRHVDAAGKPVWTPMQIARFLTKLVFALFAEDVELLPRINGKKICEYVVEAGKRDAAAFKPSLEMLFKAMSGEGSPYFYAERVAYFNGGILAESETGANDGVEVLDVSQMRGVNALNNLEDLARADWRRVNPSIFGTLFERALDPSKRAQLGAHYTSEADIKLIVQPVLMEPLQRQWLDIETEADPLLRELAEETRTGTPIPAARRGKIVRDLTALYSQMVALLAGTKVLDPACGSGNFLYVALKQMKDLEQKVRERFAPLGMPYTCAMTR